MDTKYGWKNLVQALIIIGSFIYAGIMTAYGFTSNPPNLGAWKDIGLPLSVFFAVFAILWHLMDLQTILSNKTPSIDLIDSPVRLGDVNMNMGVLENGTQYLVSGVSHMAHIVFANNPKIRTDNNSSEKVRAEITYLYTDKHPIKGPVQGRWSETTQPSRLQDGQKMTLESIDFPNNGAERVLDILIKYPEDQYCYGYNNTSYDYPYYTNPNLEIAQSKFFIKVELLGANLPKKEWFFEVYTNGVGDVFSIKHDGKVTKSETSHSRKIAKKTLIQKPLAKNKSATKRKK